VRAEVLRDQVVTVGGLEQRTEGPRDDDEALDVGRLVEDEPDGEERLADTSEVAIEDVDGLKIRLSGTGSDECIVELGR
jgi:hypothetical protein